MVKFLRLTFAFVLLAFSASAFAVITPPSEYRYRSNFNTSGFVYSSAAAACDGYLAYWSDSAAVYTISSSTAISCTVKSVRKSDGYTEYLNGYMDGQPAACPVNSRGAPTGPGCVCNSPYLENADKTLCEMPACPAGQDRVGLQCLPKCGKGEIRVDGVCVVAKCPTGTTPIDGVCKRPDCGVPADGIVGDPSVRVYSAPNYGGGSFCLDGCEVTSGMRAFKEETKKWYAWSPFRSTGDRCVPDNGSPAPPNPTPVPPVKPPPLKPDDPPRDPGPPEPKPDVHNCSAGRVPTVLNGVTVCMPADTGVTGGPKTQPPSGGPPGGPGNPVGPNGPGMGGNGPGSGGASTTGAACSGDKCVVTTTVVGDDGVPVESKEEKPKETFCTENPKSPLCVEGSFGGDCSAKFVCNGDPVQCAQARAVNESSCKMDNLPDGVSESAASVLGDEIPSGLFINGPSLIAPTAVTGSCGLRDFSVAGMFGSTLNVPMSQFCTYMNTLRAMIGVLGALAFALIVFKN